MSTETGNPFEWGPYVQVAAFCEQVLREQDNVVSLIRIVDVINTTAQGPNAPEEMPELRHPLMMFIALKSGTARGRYNVTITPQLPSGETLQEIAMSVRLEGENKGHNITSNVDIPYRMEGLYWFIVRFDGNILTRLPLEIRYSRVVTGRANPAS